MRKDSRGQWPGVVLIILVLGLTGCGAIKQKGPSYNDCLNAGSYEEAVNATASDAESNDILANLHYGYALRCNKQYEDCVVAFDKAEALYKAAEEDKILHEVEKAVAAALVNETITAYTGRLYEMTLLNTNKSMAFLCEGKMDDARVEINRALDRQRRAKEYFEDEIAREKEKIEKKKAEASNSTANPEDKSKDDEAFPLATETAERPDVKQLVAKEYSNIENFEPLADYTNPFVTYFAGLYFLLNKDYAKSVDLLKEASAMCPSNSIVLDDMGLALKLAAGINAPAGQPAPAAGAAGDKDAKGKKKSKSKDAKGKKEAVAATPPPPVVPPETSYRHAWVIFENGSGPGLESVSIPIPLLLVTKKALLTQIALPRQAPGTRAVESLGVKTGDQAVSSQPVVNMDDVAMTEFKARFPAVLLRAIESATAKALMQVAGKKVGGDIGQLVAAIYSIAVTRADTRHWISLPASYELARVRIDQTDGALQLDLPSAPGTRIQLDPTKNHLVFVGLRTPASVPYIDQIAFN